MYHHTWLLFLLIFRNVNRFLLGSETVEEAKHVPEYKTLPAVVTLVFLVFWLVCLF